MCHGGTTNSDHEAVTAKQRPTAGPGLSFRGQQTLPDAVHFCTPGSEPLRGAPHRPPPPRLPTGGRLPLTCPGRGGAAGRRGGQSAASGRPSFKAWRSPPPPAPPSRPPVTGATGPPLPAAPLPPAPPTSAARAASLTPPAAVGAGRGGAG